MSLSPGSPNFPEARHGALVRSGQKDHPDQIYCTMGRWMQRSPRKEKHQVPWTGTAVQGHGMAGLAIPSGDAGIQELPSAVRVEHMTGIRGRERKAAAHRVGEAAKRPSCSKREERSWGEGEDEQWLAITVGPPSWGRYGSGLKRLLIVGHHLMMSPPGRRLQSLYKMTEEGSAT